ncbi:lipocalin-like domain-containing protein [Phenylobacterium sp.]|uniref:lipocalin-like domain-containing protein n=1 Tax=Phenylobacterium sp. TaxID=1871053 RepID=UPI001216B7CC|nr:lipocalin-like domain-containing protein [Phenylobacterium sp.]THD57502.1 MAG: hypothetical protein E8A12_13245 [Phenylobacterium sp.]
MPQRGHELRIACAVLFATVGLSCAAMAEPAKPLTLDSAVTDYCAAWSAADRGVRDRLLARVWAPDGVYSDPEPTLAKGRTALSDAVAAFQRQYPGAHFQCSAPQMHHGAMRVTWILLRPDGSQVTQGEDIYDMARDGRIQRVVGFFGDPPQAAPILPAKASAAAQGGAAPLVGTWRLVSATERMRDGTERPDPNVGAQGRGYIVYTATGQVCAMLGHSQRARWAIADQPSAAEAGAIPENLVAYCGTYSVDEAGGFVVHHVEIDLSPNGTGTDRKRFFTVTGDRLVLRAAPPLPEDVQALTITWERVR